MNYTLPSDPNRNIKPRWMNITVYAQKMNKRPVGYLPWPEEELAKAKKKQKKR